MLIYIDKTIEVHGKVSGLTDDEKILFSDLAVAHQHGYCMLCGDLKSVEWLSKNLEGIHSSIFTKIRNKHTQMRAIMDVIETILVLSYDGQPTVPSFFEGKYKVMLINDALTYKLHLQCSMVAENLDDCHFYELIAQRFMHDTRIKGLHLSYRHELGGGNTINTVFHKCVEVDRVPTLCLVDSDIKYGPTDQYPGTPARGGTVKKLEETFNRLAKKSHPVTYELYCLPIHEAENLIPIAVLESITNTLIPDMGNGVSYLRKLRDANMSDAILCYDFKNGGNKVKDDPSVTYWIGVAEAIGDESFPQLCTKVLEKAIDVLEGNTKDKQNQVCSVCIDSYLINLWSEIGKKVFSWGCANQPIRA